MIQKNAVQTDRWLIAIVTLMLLAGCATTTHGVEEMPQRSDLFQLSNDAQLAYSSGEDAKAEQLYMALSRQTPNDPEIWFRLGNLYARAHRADAAADAYQRVLSINGNEPRAWYNLGVVRLRQGWAALIQANSYSATSEPIHIESGRMIGHLEKTPGLPQVSRNEAQQKK